MTDLNDSLDDLINAPMGEVRTAINAPADYKPREHTEPCGKCRGTGTFRGWSGRSLGACFACKGVGKLTFKTSREARAKSRASAGAREAKRAQEIAAAMSAKVEAFRAANAAACAWLDAKSAAGNNFAAKLADGLQRFGSLTQGQIDAVNKIIAQDAERAQAAPEADAAGIDRLKAAFDSARDYAQKKGRGIRNLRLTIGGIVISPAGGASKNAGALYVKNGGEYLGKIQGGRFFAMRECTQDQERRVLAFVKDPKAAAEAYGQETKICCVCNAQLTKEESMQRGMGPICAEKFGW